MTKRTAPVPLEVVEHNGYLYSTLDFSLPDSSFGVGGSGQRYYLRVRSGWEFADDAPDVVDALTKYRWGGAKCLVFANGKAYSIAGLTRGQVTYNQGPLKPLQDSNEIKPHKEAGDARILMRTPATSTVPETSASHYCEQIVTNVWKKRRFTDFVIICAGMEIPCHRSILAEASSVFEAALSSCMSEGKTGHLEILDSEPNVVKAMLSFLYTGSIDAGVEDYAKLLALADRYGIDSLVQTCVRSLWEKLSPDNIIAVNRAVRSLKEKPEFADLFSKLQEKIREEPELLAALMNFA
mmetsp:Transcript_88070/g.189025  ORF Transcript_88070/g.189025 Transcript_88070/m.189025 type:complete len:295 (+) Transcript_88070:54-938(+)|eukprot:CAMPEP_0180418544 /NCGR_PEP_ID=MMETSP1036_2-20121128/1620_1 /TAXON_ID=632150 /ORGANISM="Azadinium spinosum, Strain 3D9" /LENGTH=294 /DNA_ID=CAMNT_0022423641 /DNA_START=54 /DNA_END=938 /DNA_ORIENTATION=+